MRTCCFLKLINFLRVWVWRPRGVLVVKKMKVFAHQACRLFWKYNFFTNLVHFSATYQVVSLFFDFPFFFLLLPHHQQWKDSFRVLYILGPEQSSCYKLLVHLIIANLLIHLLGVTQRLTCNYIPSCTINFKL